ncbi:hypothetical protein tpqmel_0772 [Candidatus Gastranaerophilus sp. (ex Termes propinquus)]|nr:hypothetical protein tpqmel_0772 [Candidatus Gastranaerophilus sp. (ex Termes propinquus)]
MDKLNPISFLYKLANDSNLRQGGQNSLRQSQGAQSLNLNSQNAQNAQNAKTPAAPNLQSQGIRMMPVETLTMQNMTAAQKASYVKDLLNIPRELKDFLNEVARHSAQGQGASGSQAALLKFSVLSNILSQNADVAMQKLVQVISNAARAGVSDITQLKQMMSLIAQSAQAAGSESSQLTKNLLLLYLPWLPLNANKAENRDFELSFFEDDSEAQQSSGETVETVGIFIQTQNYGNVSATLQMEKGLALTVLLKCVEDFPRAMLEKLLCENMGECGVNTEMVAQSAKQATIEKKQERPSVKMTAQSTISPQLLLASYSLIRLVIEIDKNMPPDAPQD